MIHIHEQIEIHASPDEIWALAGDPARVGEWVPTLGGDAVLERSDLGRCYSYEPLEPPVFLSSYRSTLSIDGDGERSRVRWDAELEAENRDAAAELAATLGEISRQGLESLRSRFERLAAA